MAWMKHAKQYCKHANNTHLAFCKVQQTAERTPRQPDWVWDNAATFLALLSLQRNRDYQTHNFEASAFVAAAILPVGASASVRCGVSFE